MNGPLLKDEWDHPVGIFLIGLMLVILTIPGWIIASIAGLSGGYNISGIFDKLVDGGMRILCFILPFVLFITGCGLMMYQGWARRIAISINLIFGFLALLWLVAPLVDPDMFDLALVSISAVLAALFLWSVFYLGRIKRWADKG